MSESQVQHFLACFEDMKFNNFAFEVQMTIIQGDCGGMLFRGNEASGTSYYYRICQNGSYGFYYRVGYQASDGKLIKDTTDSSIHTGLGQSNTIAVVAKDSDITIYANNQMIYSNQNDSYTQGTIALFADEINNTTEVSFSNARAWTL